MMGKSRFDFCLVLILIIILPNKLLYSETEIDNWKFDNNYKKQMIFLHSFLNYELDTSWQLDWHRELFRKNGLKTSFGSVTVKDLNSSIEAVLNSDLGKGWFFRGEFTHIQQQMKYEPVNNNFLGFEKKIFQQFSIFSQCNPAYDKEDIDLLLGFSFMNKSADNYCRLALNYDDFLYDEKNPSGGKVVAEPLGIKWAVRYSYQGFLLSSFGKIMNVFEIEFPDSSLSPEKKFHSKKNDEFKVWLFYFFNSGHIAELNFYQYFFQQIERFYSEVSNYKYRDRITDLALKYNHHLHENLTLRGVVHFVKQEAVANGMREYDFSRTELLPMIMFQFARKNSLWEIAYLRSSYDLTLNDEIEILSYNREKTFQKFMLRWTYNFNAAARLQFSLSHVPNIEGYGGGNLNFMLFY
jgi:hypothetical protein